MGLTAKAKSSSEGWGLGLLLVFFPDDDSDSDKKKKLLSSSSSFKSTTSSNNGRCSSNGSLLLSRAQSIISICSLIVFFTLLLFTLCTFEPTLPNPTNSIPVSRRWLSENSSKDYSFKHNSKRYSSSSSSWFAKLWKTPDKDKKSRSRLDSSVALQGMGTLFRRGTKAMNDLVVGHLMEDIQEHELRLFLRTLHRSGITARSDFVLIFPSSLSSNSSSNFSTIIREENEFFLQLVRHYRESNNNTNAKSVSGFDVTQFVKSGKKEKERGEPLWGRRIHSNYSNPEGENREGEFTELSWGSVVGFESSELDPEDSLSGFLDRVPMGLRRWACYPMLLGRVRRNFKHIMLVDVKDVVVLGDSLARVRNRSPESVLFSSISKESLHGKQGRRNSEKTQKESKPALNPAVIMGGIRGIRRLSNAMLTEIVRAAIQHKSKSKNSVSESGLLNQLVRNGLVLKNIDIITSTESIPDTSSLASRNSSSSSDFSVVHRGNSNLNLNTIVLKGICSSPIDSSVYRDC
ncbi:hypothetical protein HHK36_011882 [Tetracentron sinense]|uniref:DUF7780 domain-containing protein n=1 Tax=Tetracentron sinense TaxID=13715 RepID=A0A834ZJF6_TETSI|nr:hypothetical protein HHK36_011882 [Tetracentron sinense]